MHRNNGLSLDADLEHRIEAYAQATKCTPSDVVRKAFEENEATHNGSHEDSGADESAYEAFKRAGVIGCVKGGPADLSTNPKYMKGFGGD